MPRKAPDDSDENVIHATTEFNPSLLKRYVADIEGLQSEIDAVEAAAKKKKAPKRQAIQKLMKQAAEDGLPKKELAAHLRRRRHLRAADAVLEELDDGQKETCGRMWNAQPWAGTPLGMAVAAE